jgi:hypothetical protein
MKILTAYNLGMEIVKEMEEVKWGGRGLVQDSDDGRGLMAIKIQRQGVSLGKEVSK